MGHKSGEKVGSSYCHGLGGKLMKPTKFNIRNWKSDFLLGNQVFAYTKRQQIMSDDNCLDASNANGPVNLVRCHGMGGNQEWSYDENVSFDEVNRKSLIIILFTGSHNKTRELRKLLNSSNKRRPINASVTSLYVREESTVAHAIKIQVAIKTWHSWWRAKIGFAETRQHLIRLFWRYVKAPFAKNYSVSGWL